MSDRAPRAALAQFLTVAANDAGCAETMELLDIYVDAVASGVDVEIRFPGITAHLRSCTPCVTDFDGLLAAVRHEAQLGVIPDYL
ncbi:MAG TPA: hypothetical protein VHX59_21055 [Mycobacteriales bacterium]|nr:hypothetical protein [Mycobacteriales bacterium]